MNVGQITKTKMIVEWELNNCSVLNFTSAAVLVLNTLNENLIASSSANMYFKKSRDGFETNFSILQTRIRNFASADFILQEEYFVLRTIANLFAF